MNLSAEFRRASNTCGSASPRTITQAAAILGSAGIVFSPPINLQIASKF
jgi:hypothetical protein